MAFPWVIILTTALKRGFAFKIIRKPKCYKIYGREMPWGGRGLLSVVASDVIKKGWI